jgi:formate hydrogenlyase transcriptional activator
MFLDEAGDLPLEMQPKLLWVIEEKEFEQVGGTRLIRLDFRLIYAGNRNLEKDGAA